MENLFIEASETTPKVSLDITKMHFEFKGESMPESPVGFYEPVIRWLESYFAENTNTRKEISVDFKIDYFNSSSANSILDLLKIFDKAAINGFKIKIQWFYDHRDQDIKESGEEFKAALEINSFELVAR